MKADFNVFRAHAGYVCCHLEAVFSFCNVHLGCPVGAGGRSLATGAVVKQAIELTIELIQCAKRICLVGHCFSPVLGVYIALNESVRALFKGSRGYFFGGLETCMLLIVVNASIGMAAYIGYQERCIYEQSIIIGY